MALLIPVQQGVPAWSQETMLDGQKFVLHFRWNDTDQAWYLSVHDLLDEPIVSGRRLVADWPVMHRVADPRRPKGEIMVVDLLLNGGTPRYEDLNDKCELTYFTAAELGRV